MICCLRGGGFFFIFDVVVDDVDGVFKFDLVVGCFVCMCLFVFVDDYVVDGWDVVFLGYVLEL